MIETDVIDIIILKEKTKLLLNVILIVFCVFNIIVNDDINKNVLSNKYTNVRTIEELNKAYKNNDKIISMDLTNAKKENYQIKGNKSQADIYTLNLEDKNILVLLRENTILTDLTNVEFINNKSLIVSEINSKFEKNNYYKLVLSNINLNSNIKFILYKLYVLLILIFLSIISIIFNIINMLKPKCTLQYKKYIKKNHIND